MSPLQFEREHAPEWQALESLLTPPDPVGSGRKRAPWRRLTARRTRPVEAARLSDLYRRSCEHLALARDRAYPPHLIHRLERLTEQAHALIYARSELGLGRLRQLALVDFPQAVRAHAAYVGVAAALFTLPLLCMAWACWRDPGFALHLMSATELKAMEAMYGDEQRSIGAREASTDWMMFGYYIRNNIGIAFQCFASGLFAGLGSIFFTVYNGALIGAVAGHLSARGLGQSFYPFVVTHSAFELTAIVLSAAAGLRLGHALLAPGRLARGQALVRAAPQAVVLVYGASAMLLVAAALEAFWSSSRWVPSGWKFAVGGACWLLVFTYLGWQGRPPSGAREAA
jgi:uncharacterized membrane protein SpoIIM required for sporulation